MSVFLRQGYFFTLTFASALLAASSVPLVMPDYFRLPAGVPLIPVACALWCAVGLLLQWPHIRLLTMAFLSAVVILALLAAIATAGAPSISWSVLAILFGILLTILLISNRIRAYLMSR